MRKFLFVLLIIILFAIMYLVVWYDIPSFEFINTYTEVQDAYEDYQSVLKTLEDKNENELPAVLAKLDTEYSKADGADLDNVVKQYNSNKEKYEYYLALEKANEMIDQADIYNVEYIWTQLGKYAKNNYLDMSMNIVKSEADLQSDDYIMCNLDFDVTGQYQYITQFLEDVETDSSIGFQINDFFAEGYNNTAKYQSKTKNMDTDNIPSENSKAEDGSDQEYTIVSTPGFGSGAYATSESSDDSHELDIKASFRVYNIPINKRTITNVKGNSDLTTNLDDTSEENGTVDGDGAVTE